MRTDCHCRLLELFPSLAHVEDSTLIYPHYSRLDMLFGDVSYDWSKQYVCHVWKRIANNAKQVMISVWQHIFSVGCPKEFSLLRQNFMPMDAGILLERGRQIICFFGRSYRQHYGSRSSVCLSL